jgi:hypothetical protein
MESAKSGTFSFRLLARCAYQLDEPIHQYLNRVVQKITNTATANPMAAIKSKRTGHDICGHRRK